MFREFPGGRTEKGRTLRNKIRVKASERAFRRGEEARQDTSEIITEQRWTMQECRYLPAPHPLIKNKLVFSSGDDNQRTARWPSHPLATIPDFKGSLSLSRLQLESILVFTAPLGTRPPRCLARFNSSWDNTGSGSLLGFGSRSKGR